MKTLVAWNARKVFQIDPETDRILEEFKSACQAARAVGGSPSHIAKVCRGERQVAYKYKWEYVEE